MPTFHYTPGHYHTFLICGFPRSRTLWLSQFLTIPGYSFCDHEATERAASPDEFWSNAEAHKVHAYGNSDSANIFVLPSMLAAKPMTRVIWIARPIDEVYRSMKESGIGFEQKALLTLVRLRDQHWNYFDAVFDYDALVHHDICRVIWDMCLPGLPFDYDRWSTYNATKICYSKTNPYPQKDYNKFMTWVSKDMADEKEYNAL